MDLRFSVFLMVLLGCLALETYLPRRGRVYTRLTSNLLVSVVNTLVLRFLMPITAIGTALWAEQNNLGLFNQFNTPFNSFFAVITLDLIIYGQHILFHKIPIFWAVHKMHHADVEMDVTTGIRFHPLEAMLSMVLKCAAVLILGASPLAVIVFEIILSAGSLFSHSNIKLPFDKALRKIMVTPDMHRIHHSVHRHETDSNYGFSTSLWDRFFKTYREEPQDGHETMLIGLSEFRDETRIDKLLTQPFRKS
jgi:sterol desaturase/sphingolipid hydroxylase (fatty acid hydroxylase superfamily)